MKDLTTDRKLKVSSRVARLIGPDGSLEEQRQVAGGQFQLCNKEELLALFVLARRGAAEVRDLAISTLKGIAPYRLVPLLCHGEIHPQVLDFVARQRHDDASVLVLLLDNSGLARQTLLSVASRCSVDVLSFLVDRHARSHVEGLREAIEANPAAEGHWLARFDELSAQTDEPVDDDEDDWDEEIEEEGQSVYQQIMNMGVAEKVKAALTGDKEWRKLLIRESNKLVSAAVLKNPRISDGEVLAVVNNKSSNEELIRIVTMNREWMKNYAIKQALVVHPRTPPALALRFMNILSERDLKTLSKSRDISQVIANSARRMLNAKSRQR
ncbi:hypothetical protein A7E78_01085 [Syntrophotalea acetylenivorans]|uniref:Uncharacterized protein n=1 Tax=Syntrophotalea acetylenivorans TaxID=1842532 RepID=A0A1L3GKW6_9BACT|nr:hypothetical protein [Syntrophotalea acetylenivorans]APG26576.1 hypothetical protein A7E78_01085 [Syntrophotalea acetylenivorans]